jgi:hypothetical protein
MVCPKLDGGVRMGCVDLQLTLISKENYFKVISLIILCTLTYKICHTLPYQEELYRLGELFLQVLLLSA